MRSAFIEVDLRRLALNVELLCRAAGDKNLMAVVKANAYGHGAIPAAQVALQAGAQWLGVATQSEAEEIRHAGIVAPVLILGHLRPDEYETCARHNVSVTVSDPVAVDHASHAAARAGRALGVHLKLDTGMGRIGARPQDALELARRIAASEHLRFEGAFSHLSSAGQDEAFTRRQIDLFQAALTRLEKASLLPPWRHILNSAGTLANLEAHATNLVRTGIAMYGLNPDGVGPAPKGLQPVMSLHAHVNFVKRVPKGTAVGYGQTYVADREVQIATLGIGYADGYRRGFSGRARVLIGGMHWRVAGRVSMDQTTVAVDSDFPVSVGDEAVLMGRQQDREVTAEELAGLVGTINYEVVTGMSPRLPRVYRPRS